MSEDGIMWTEVQLYCIDDGEGFPTACKLDLDHASGVALVLFTSHKMAKKYMWSYTRDPINIRALQRRERDGTLLQYDLVRMARKMLEVPMSHNLIGALIDPTASSIGTFVSIDDLRTHGMASRREANPKTAQEIAMKELLGE